MKRQNKKTTANKTDNTIEINKSKVLANDEKLKRYRDMVKQYKKAELSKISKENSTNKSAENVQGQTNNQIQKI